MRRPPEDWQRRVEIRKAAVVSIKASVEYRSLQADREAGDDMDAIPDTPNPHDREISKRSWEKKVMDWRNALRSLRLLKMQIEPFDAEQLHLIDR